MSSLIQKYMHLNSDDRIYLGYSFLYSGLILFIVFWIILYDPYGTYIDPEKPQKDVLSVSVINEQEEKNSREVGLMGAMINIPIASKLDEKPVYTPPPQDCDSPIEINKINTEEKIVVFSFDADGHDYSMPAILSAFRKRDLRTTFFMEGRWASVNKDYVRQIDKEGHEIFNHSLTHVNLTTVDSGGVKNELIKSDELINSITGKSTKPFFRPPYGGRDEKVLKAACEVGFQSVVWNLDAFDWRETRGISAKEVQANILNNTKPGSIILMHTGNNHTAAVLDFVLETLQKRGYKIMALTDALEYAEKN